MSTLCEEAVVCNYRCFSSLLANTTNKCSRVTGQHVSEKLFVCLCSWDHTTTTPYCFYRFSSPIFFGASSGFRVAMWKALASNPSKYNNRAISSLSQWFSPVCAFFFFASRCWGGAVFCEHRAWSRASPPLLFPGLFLFVDLHVFYWSFFPIFSRFYAVVVLFPITVYDETTRKPGALWRERNSCLVTSKRVWGKGWVCLEGSGPEVAKSQSVDELFLFWRTRIKGPYLRRSNAKLAFSF